MSTHIIAFRASPMVHVDRWNFSVALFRSALTGSHSPFAAGGSSEDSQGDSLDAASLPDAKLERWGLSENRVSQNPSVYHQFPYIYIVIYIIYIYILL